MNNADAFVQLCLHPSARLNTHIRGIVSKTGKADLLRELDKLKRIHRTPRDN